VVTQRWSNGPGDTYPSHSHDYTKALVCERGSITFHLSDGTAHALRAGDRLVVPAGTTHSAVVGSEGCTCAETHQ
jgi:quercetin dioxygenase-like cupin family protein